MAQEMAKAAGNWRVQLHAPTITCREEAGGRRQEAEDSQRTSHHPSPSTLHPSTLTDHPALDIYVGRTPELMQLAICCMACSGSVSLELLYYTKPTVILYAISRFAFELQKVFRKVRYITLVNLLSSGELYSKERNPYDPEQPDDREALFPEYVTHDDKSASIAAHIVRWLTDENRLALRIADLETLKRSVAHGGASARAAEYILAAR
jgi:lipid-A-disaccharide synthase